MKVQTFTAPTAKQAIEAVHSTFGPEALVVNIRKLPKPGWQGLFQSPQVEVSAVLPEVSSSEQAIHSEKALGPAEEQTPLADGSVEPNGRKLDIVDDTPIEIPKSNIVPVDELNLAEPSSNTFDGSFGEALGQAGITAPPPGPECVVSIEIVLESIGILPLQIERLLRLAKQRFPNLESCALGDQIQYVRHCLIDHWNRLAKAAEDASQSRKVLVGAPGSGKTTVLCKWLTQTVLAKRQSAKVWRLDGHLYNTAEMLTVHSEMLEVEVNRVWYPEPITDGVVQFFDLPGVMSGDSNGMNTLMQLANEIQTADFILVLNSAYEFEHLIRTVREFSDLPIKGLIVTHLDEETRWSKLWNLTLESGLPILYCSGGQDIPGDFVKLTSEMLFQSVIQQLETTPSVQNSNMALN